MQRFGFTGSPRTVAVPSGVAEVEIQTAGASGGSGIFARGAVGARVTGVLPVHPGQVITVGVGGRGGDHNGEKAPGKGGWGLDGHGGGRGGGGYGLNNEDGSGGGGASVVDLDGQPVVIAAGGGGASGGSDGGSGGGDDYGNKGKGDGGGRGATPTSNYDPTGRDPVKGFPDYQGWGDGGGGGGGGWHAGEGGAGTGSFTSTGGGGGGNSLHIRLTDAFVDPAPAGDGMVSLVWVPNGTTPIAGAVNDGSSTSLRCPPGRRR